MKNCVRRAEKTFINMVLQMPAHQKLMYVLWIVESSSPTMLKASSKLIGVLQIIDMDLSQLKREVKSEVEDTTTQECDASVLYVDVTKSSEAALSRLHIKNKEKVSLVCPKAQCRKQYVHRHKGKLLSHIMRFHMNDPEHNELMAAFRQLFPERNKTPRKACELCGKLIAGRGAQMRKHQGKSGCKFFRK